jgi:hypothetical protein
VPKQRQRLLESPPKVGASPTPEDLRKELEPLQDDRSEAVLELQARQKKRAQYLKKKHTYREGKHMGELKAIQEKHSESQAQQKKRSAKEMGRLLEAYKKERSRTRVADREAGDEGRPLLGCGVLRPALETQMDNFSKRGRKIPRRAQAFQATTGVFPEKS